MGCEDVVDGSFSPNRLNTQKQDTSNDSGGRYDAENDLGLDTALHQRVSSSVFRNGPNIICEPADQSYQCQKPEDDAEWEGYFLF